MGYGKTNMQQVNSIMGSDGQDNHFYTVPDNGDRVFICPPIEGSTLPFRNVKVHYGLQTGIGVACLKQFGSPCPACVANQELFNDGKKNPIAAELSSQIYAKDNFIYNVIGGLDLRQASPTQWVAVYVGYQGSQSAPVIKPWLTSPAIKGQFQTIFGLFGDIFDPMNGYLMMVSKMQATPAKNGQMIRRVQINAMPNKVQLDASLLALVNNIPDLNKELPPISVDQMKQLVDLKLSTYRSGMVSEMPQVNSTQTYSVAPQPAATMPAPTYTPPVNVPMTPTFVAPVQAQVVQPTVVKIVEMPPPPSTFNAQPVPQVQTPVLSSPVVPNANLSDLEKFIMERDAANARIKELGGK